ncbi:MULTISPECIES: STAS domain-containing protein [Mycobacteriaceae]|uniref:STAS domain-containing protein n=1 Tax=Mycobacteriaceae TaxID=1762 RepID=UPI0007FF05C4|nr:MULTISPECIES: STAS domain-containing protein [Mycobacteriaceae]MCK0173813.1 STAS domain-containing protein [Mycolicibacterium sp. F2034L]OBB57138.1 anti-anti-sigma factor [Mycobacterium sp. 852013-51886_SCH5428379]
MTVIAPTRTARDRLTFSTEWESATDVRIAVRGDIDASNAAEVAEYTFRRGANSRRLTLDLNGVDFLSTAGFSVLCTIHQRCVKAGVDWTLVGNAMVLRVIGICDPHRTLPVTAA